MEDKMGALELVSFLAFLLAIVGMALYRIERVVKEQEDDNDRR